MAWLTRKTGLRRPKRSDSAPASGQDTMVPPVTRAVTRPKGQSTGTASTSRIEAVMVPAAA